MNSFAIRVSSSGGTDGCGYATLMGLGASGWSKYAIGHTRTGGYDVGDIIDNADCTRSDEKMGIISVVNISCTGSISCDSISLSNACIVAGNVGIKNASQFKY